MAEIWDTTDKLGTYTWARLPEPGDIIEVDVDGTVSPYRVNKLSNYYALDAVDPVLRIIVSYDGPSWLGVV